MKKFIVSFITIIALAAPSLASATTLTSSQVSAIMSLLKDFGVGQAVLDSVYTDLVPGSPASSTSSCPYLKYGCSASKVNARVSNSTPVTFSAYHSNPWQYDGQNVSLIGMEDVVIPVTNAGGASFIEVEDPFDMSQPKIELQINSQADYMAAVDALTGNAGDPIPQFVTAVGIGIGTQPFVMTSLLGKSTVSVPVISVSNLYQCAHGSMDTTVLTGTTIQDGFHCSQWVPIFPGSAQSINASTQTQPTPAPQPPMSDNQNSPAVPPIPAPQPSASDNQQLPAAPTCALTASPLLVSSDQESKLSWTSVNATSGSIGGIGALSNLNSAMWVSPTATMTYTATFSGSGGSTECSATVNFIPPTETNGKLNQAITFNPLRDVTYGIVGFTIDAQASSGLGVNFTAQGDCTVSNDGTTVATGLGTASVYITDVGSCTVSAHQPGDATYNAAPDVSQMFTINPASN